MENKLKMGEQPVTLEKVRLLLGTPDVEKVMANPLEDSFQYLRYLVDPRKAEDMRLMFTVAVEGDPGLTQIQLRNGVIVISEASENGAVHLNVTEEEWAGFVTGQSFLADRNGIIAKFESVLVRPTLPAATDARR